MKNQKQNSLSLLVAIFTLISVIAVGSMYLSLERSQNATVSSNISKLNRQMEVLTRQNLDLSTRIARLENPMQLKMHLGKLSPMSESIVITQNYKDIENGTNLPNGNVALGYSYSNKIGNINSVRQ